MLRIRFWRGVSKNRGLWCGVWYGDGLKDRGYRGRQAGWDLAASRQFTLGGDGSVPLLAFHAEMVAAAAVTAPGGLSLYTSFIF